MANATDRVGTDRDTHAHSYAPCPSPTTNSPARPRLATVVPTCSSSSSGLGPNEHERATELTPGRKIAHVEKQRRRGRIDESLVWITRRLIEDEEDVSG
jgi:hypothetical protein